MVLFFLKTDSIGFDDPYLLQCLSIVWSMLPPDSTTIPCSPHSTGRLLGGFIYTLDLSCPPESEKLQIHITRLTLFRLRSGYLCKVFIHPDLYKNLKFINLIFIASFTLYNVYHQSPKAKTRQSFLCLLSFSPRTSKTFLECTSSVLSF